mmetsp:Transcript_53100/g.63950  ORF Transcript_53100/g.63950 Transcript_53100/m.63950 type:complete len:377 (+) Transcript_53100:65-1195(+)
MTTIDQKCRIDLNYNLTDAERQPPPTPLTATNMPTDNDSGSLHPSVISLMECIELSVQSLLKSNFVSSEDKQGAKQNQTKGLVNGLGSVNIDALKSDLEPVLQSLRKVDAEGMLQLQRQASGSGREEDCFVGIGNRIQVAPIHKKIIPPPPACWIEGDSHRCVRYLHVTENPGRYSVGIFVFPPGASIPLHDHPEMCVLSRILYGELSVKSYDILAEKERKQEYSSPGHKSAQSHSKTVEKSYSDNKTWFSTITSTLRRQLSNNTRLSSDEISEATAPEGAKHVINKTTKIIRAPDVTSLFPLQGNLHEFTAGKNGAAVLDVLLPPYDFDHDRDCTFYQEASLCRSGNSDVYLLVPIPQPGEFHCISGKYLDFGEE